MTKTHSRGQRAARRLLAGLALVATATATYLAWNESESRWNSFLLGLFLGLAVDIGVWAARQTDQIGVVGWSFLTAGVFLIPHAVLGLLLLGSSSEVVATLVGSTVLPAVTRLQRFASS